jgi:hypothetical protein
LRLLELSGEVLEAGRAFISGIVHSLGADHGHLWQLYIDHSAHLNLPEESGGLEAVARIRERCRVLRDDPSRVEYLAPRDLSPTPELQPWSLIFL